MIDVRRGKDKFDVCEVCGTETLIVPREVNRQIALSAIDGMRKIVGESMMRKKNGRK
jgi:hypothetical protein